MASLDPYSGKLGSRLAKHLLRRTSFNITKARIEEFADYDVSDALGVLLAPCLHRLQRLQILMMSLSAQRQNH